MGVLALSAGRWDVTAVLASGLWQDPVIHTIRVIVAFLLVPAGFFMLVVGLLAHDGMGHRRSLWLMLWGFLLGLGGCLIGSVTAALVYLAVFAGIGVFGGLISGLAALTGRGFRD